MQKVVGFGLWVVLALCLLAGRSAWAAGQVYLSIGSDTAVWNAPGGLDVGKYREHFSPDVYTRPDQNAYRVIDPAFRAQLTDSYGLPMKLTWWILVGSAYGQSDNANVPVPNLMPLYLMQHYHGEVLRQLGDEVSLHYHTFYWSDYNSDGIYYWNEARTFHECRADWDLALAQSLVEEEVFPVSFRSGWHYMDNEWQQYLNELLLFSMDDDSPLVKGWSNLEPTFNVLDWSRAPTNFVPFHPATNDYQVPGDGAGWNVHCVKFPNVTQAMVDAVFAQAAGGTDQVVSFWGHLPESDFPSNLAKMDALAHNSASNYPTVMFRYCTAIEAMQRWLQTADHTPPNLDVSENSTGEAVTLSLATDETIFQPQPFVAVKDIYQHYSIVPCASAGSNRWTAPLPVPRAQLAKVGIAVTDTSGNLTTRVIRYLPDDVYIDNLDPQYSELMGDWTQNTNAAWGTDSRVATLAPNSTAKVRWTLPVSAAASYTVFAQVPAVALPAGNVSFSLRVSGSNLFTTHFPDPLPPNQWVYLGTASLDPGQINEVDMEVSAGDQTNTMAVADVLKLSPLVYPMPGFITNVHVEAEDQTANVTWTTTAPATGQIDYGLDASYGAFSPTNSWLDTAHVITLFPLKPGIPYSFRINSEANGLISSTQGSFITSNSPTPPPAQTLFGITQPWHYSTNNLDNAPEWKARDFDDSSWPTGPGLLWVDVRPGGPDPAVQPKSTPLPANPETGFPFVTYYFRTHFLFTNSLAGTTLTLSNFVDDGAVFYLNGIEVYRTNMATFPAAITNSTLATAYKCDGDATCPLVFSLGADALTNLAVGDNVLAAEVHNYSRDSVDITFGSALYCVHVTPPPTSLRYLHSAQSVTLYWSGSGFTLQRASGVASSDWADLSGTSPYQINDSATAFYRLRY